MTLTEIRAAVRARLGETTADFWSTTSVDQAINDAVKKFSREERWPWLYTFKNSDTLTVGTSTVTFPGDVDIMRGFSVGLLDGSTYVSPDPQRVSHVEGQKIKRTFSSNGTPRYYWFSTAAMSTPAEPADEVYTYTMKFAPAADKTYTVEFSYIRRPALLVNAAPDKEPDMPEDYHPAVVAWATFQLWTEELQGAENKAMEQFNLYQMVLADAKRDFKRFAEDENIHVGRPAQPRREGVVRLPNGYGWPQGW